MGCLIWAAKPGLKLLAAYSSSIEEAIIPSCNSFIIVYDRVRMNWDLVLRPGFEPESSARKAGMIDRTTLPERICILADCHLLFFCHLPPYIEGFPRYMYISDARHSVLMYEAANSPGRIRTAVAGSKGLQA
jgi:hypothetical protein